MAVRVMVAGYLLAGPSSVLLASCLEEPMEEVREGVSTSELCLRDGLVIYITHCIKYRGGL